MSFSPLKRELLCYSSNIETANIAKHKGYSGAYSFETLAHSRLTFELECVRVLMWLLSYKAGGI